MCTKSLASDRGKRYNETRQDTEIEREGGLHMAVLLSDLYESVKNQDMTLVAGEKGMNNDWVINELYRDCRYQPPILFHLPEHMANYVATIVNRSFALLSADLIGIIGSYQPSDEIVKAVLSSPLEDYVEPNND